MWGHYESQMKVVQIEVLYVVPKYRKQGIATQLKRYLEIWAKDVGAIEAIVRNNNDNMVALNQKLGYQTTHLKMTKNL
ncbi:GNAT family N-acetyltransferase [Staphylococcus saccharolyticus]|uniref:GNAT family N-acetyltransferase n=1 Tax=Staphylococcus saccharolyticus TaxID=33028 RepID=UPI0023AF0BD7|nr:GNAT family N-acetyltransferase [Staphylococcus saccharolyticus]